MSKLTPKEALILAARRKFSEKGYHGTTIREIAQAVGLLSGSLYAHIDSKEDLLFQIVDEGAELFLNALEPIASSSGEPIQRLRAGLTAHIKIVTTQIDSAKVFLDEWMMLTQIRRDEINKKRTQYESYWTKILEDAIREGAIKDEHLSITRMLILSVGNWVYRWYKPDGSLSANDIADRFLDKILYGILTDKAQACRI